MARRISKKEKSLRSDVPLCGQFPLFQNVSSATAGAMMNRPIFPIDLVDVTVAPVLAWFERLDDRVLRRVKMFRRMFVLTRITTTDVTTCPTQS
jgi:hypothetical protein